MFKVIRKIGKMLRGGAGAREIFRGVLLGVLIGILPGANLSLLLLILLLLLLNANVGFALLGAALGKLVCLSLAGITFQIGYVIIHNMGLETVFRMLTNAPVAALMGFDNYCQVGGFPLALVLGLAIGILLSRFITRIREQMIKAGENEKVKKTANNKLVKFLLWLTFGKQKLSAADALAKHSPLLRKSGVVLVAVVLVVSLALEFLLLDKFLKSGITAAISGYTGAEVNIDKADLSIIGGRLELENVQVTDPDQPTQNIVQISALAADVGMGDLLRKRYAVDLLKGSRMEFDTPRATPGKIYPKVEKEKKEKPVKEQKDGQEIDIDKYLTKAKKWKTYLEKLKEYLDERHVSAEKAEKKEPPVANKKKTVDRAKQFGYLNTTADNLITDHPAWTIHRIEIDKVRLGDAVPEQLFIATGVSSHPELNGQSSIFAFQPGADLAPLARLALRFDNPAAPHELAINMTGVKIDGIDTGDDIPVIIREADMDATVDGTFVSEKLDLPYSLRLHGLSVELKEGETIKGLDRATAQQVLSALDQIHVKGAISGSLSKPTVTVDYKQLMDDLNNSLVAAGKKELMNKANAEMDKAKSELKDKAGSELNKLLKDEDTEKKTKGLLKKLL